MQFIHKKKNSNQGQVLVMATVLLLICTTLMLGLFQVSLAVQEKIHLQISADLAVLSALNSQANGLNSIAMANRAILANDALAGQLNAMVSETTFYRKLVEKFRKLLRFIPYAGPISHFISTGIHAVEKTTKRITALCLPLARHSNNALRKWQEYIQHLLPIYSLKAARTTLQENTPGAKMTTASEALVLRQANTLRKCISGLNAANVKKVKTLTMDNHSLKRNWRVRVAGMSPVKKTGGTSIFPDDLTSRDTLRFKVLRRLRWRWKTAISTKSKTSDFNYLTPSDFLSLNLERSQSAFSLPILVRSEMPPSITEGPFKEKEMYALTAGRLFYRRSSRPEETANLFNPFWKSELIAVASEPTARRLIPNYLLKEVKH